jgi:hypothetical protein
VVSHIPHHADLFQVMASRKLCQAQVDVLLMTLVTGVHKSQGKITHVICDSKAGTIAYAAKAFVDASGDCDLVAMCRAPFHYSPHCSATLLFEMGNVDLDVTFQYFCAHPEDYDEEKDGFTPFADFKSNFLERDIFFVPHHNGQRIKPIQNAIRDGLYAREKGLASLLDVFGMFGKPSTRRVLINSNYFFPDVIGDETSVSRSLLEARSRCLETAGLLKQVMPGFHDGTITHMASELGVRGSRRLAGRHAWTLDYLNPLQYPDVIGVASPPDRRNHASFNVEVPFSALLPQEISNLIVGSGRSIHNAVRFQPYCMVIGQAAGVAAAIAARDDCEIDEVPIQHLQRQLLGQDVYLGNAARLAELGLTNRNESVP